jgi:hypothetical protein
VVERVVEVDADVEALKREYGSAENAIRKLYRDSYKGREGRRVLKAVDEGKAVILKDDDLKDWTEFRKLGKKPADLATIVTDYGKLQTRVTTTEREAAGRRAAKALQWNEDASASVAARAELDLSFETEEVDGKKVEVPYVQPKEQGAAKVKLADFVKDAKRFDPLYLPALQARSGGGNDTREGVTTDSARGTPWIEQPSSTPSGKSPNGGEPVKPTGPAFLREKRMLPSQRK